jgi:hypothetical protein
MTKKNDIARWAEEQINAALGDVQPVEPAKPKRPRRPNKAAIVVNGDAGQIAGGDINNVHMIHTEKVIQKTVAVPQPGEEHITEEQVAELHRLKDEIIRLETIAKKSPATHQTVWGALNRKMKVGAMRMIPKDKFPAAKRFMQQWIGRLSDRPTVQKKDPGLRTRRIRAIKTNTRQDTVLEAKVLAYMQNNFGKTSVGDLDQQELEQTYRYMLGTRKPRGDV